MKSNEEIIDEFIETNHYLTSRIFELRQEIMKLKEQHYENEWKLNTLEKFYTCPNCAFNNKEMKYLKKLRKNIE